jgi:nicotinate phosphoribosyltransferase
MDVKTLLPVSTFSSDPYPEHGGFAVMAGLEQMVEYLNALEFTDMILKWLGSTGHFDQRFLE